MTKAQTRGKRSRLWRWSLWGLFLVACAVLFAAWRVNAVARGRGYANAADVPQETPPRIALVFGAGVWANNTPSPVLYDRVAAAVELYQAGRVRKLLMSGDNRFVDYNEPEVMKQTALQMGVPEQDIVLDYAGRRTYDSCYRAREIFGVERAVLVTQQFHLARAIYLCNALGVDSVGLAADKRDYGSGRMFQWSTRERLARLFAWTDINLWQPTPVGGEKMIIE